jgi:hypothetical protein
VQLALIAPIGPTVRRTRLPTVVLTERSGIRHDENDDDEEIIATINARVGAALENPEYVEAERRVDLSAEFHRTATMRWFEDAGLDQEIAEALYRVEWEPESRSVYPSRGG